MKIFHVFLIALGLTWNNASLSNASAVKRTNASAVKRTNASAVKRTNASAVKRSNISELDAVACEDCVTGYDYWFQGIEDKGRGKTGEAIKDYRRAISLEPNVLLFHTSLADLHYEQNRLPEAVTELRLIVRLKPTLAYWHLRLGNTLNLTGQRVQARQEWQKVVLLDGNDDYGDEAEKMLKLFAS